MALPVLSWREVLKALGKKGFKPIRQKGSHIYLQNESGRYTVVPRHAGIKKSTLMKILAEAGLSREEFLDLL